MIFKGIKFKKCTSMLWRNGNEEIDKDFYGNPVNFNHIVVIQKKDCPIIKKNNKEYYDVKNATKTIPLRYSLTNMGYAKQKRKNKETYTPVYLVIDGQLYVGSIKE